MERVNTTLLFFPINNEPDLVRLSIDKWPNCSISLFLMETSGIHVFTNLLNNWKVHTFRKEDF